MYIYNFKVNGGLLLKIIIILLSLFMLMVFSISIYRIFISSGKFVVNDKIDRKEITQIDPNNYTNILKSVHENPDSYIGIKINFTGYIYRLLDFNEDQFVIARDMILDENKTKSVVVGFLCQYKDSDDFEDGKWVNLTGVIEMGKYHNEDIPIIKVTKIQEAEEPENSFVNPPNNTYIPTNGLL